MKKFLKIVFNIFWILLIGITGAILSAITGAVLCLTIIGIPLGVCYFKYIKLIFAPAGKVVILNYSKHPVLNTLWLIFGGLLNYIISFFTTLLLYISIIGIPLAIQYSKIRKYFLAPFGAEIVNEDHYSQKEDTNHNVELLTRHICANPNLIIKKSPKDNSQTVSEFIFSKKPEFEIYMEKKRNRQNFFIKATKILTIVSTIIYAVSIIINFIIMLANTNSFSELNNSTADVLSSSASSFSGNPGSPTIIANLILGTPLYFLLFYFFFAYTTIFINYLTDKKSDRTFCKKYLLCLMTYYPNGTALEIKKRSTLKNIATQAGLKWNIEKRKLFPKRKKKQTDK